MDFEIKVSAAVIVTLVLFFITQTIALFRWISGISRSLESIAVRMEERTSAMMGDLRKVNHSLEALATADLRLSNVEKGLSDHETRIREIESETRFAPNHRVGG